MGLFDFFKGGNNKTSQINVKELVGSFQENINKWSDAEKALLAALLIEIGWADGDFCETEKTAWAITLFGAGILEDIMHIQNLADDLYWKGEVGDLEKIANDFNNLSSIKKEYIIKSVSEIMEADGTISPQEIAMANKLTGS